MGLYADASVCVSSNVDVSYLQDSVHLITFTLSLSGQNILCKDKMIHERSFAFNTVTEPIYLVNFF